MHIKFCPLGGSSHWMHKLFDLLCLRALKFAFIEKITIIVKTLLSNNNNYYNKVIL